MAEEQIQATKEQLYAATDANGKTDINKLRAIVGAEDNPISADLFEAVSAPDIRDARALGIPVGEMIASPGRLYLLNVLRNPLVDPGYTTDDIGQSLLHAVRARYILTCTYQEISEILYAVRLSVINPEKAARRLSMVDAKAFEVLEEQDPEELIDSVRREIISAILAIVS